ncbi:hypothetical protein [Streptomyces rubiginosohelvolus]|uniref:hypothetical protein n=1 Tax=Streptomyces rubiginosohelvolus TaxID=67362 RepID=UPI0035D831DC
MLGQGWESQWDRVGRRLEDVRAVYEGAPGGTDVAVDRVLSFFEAVYHLKDWLGNDPTVQVTKANGDELIDKHQVLQLCADLANGSKHLKLDRTRTGDISTTVARNDVEVLVGTGSSRHRFYVASGGTEYDARQIAEDAVTEWERFLSRRGLV